MSVSGTRPPAPRRGTGKTPRPPSAPSSAKAREELGIHLAEREISYAATDHCRNTDTDTRIGVFFQATAKDTPLGTPYNAEPHKCAKIAWYPMTLLPATTMPYSSLGVSLYQRKMHFGTLGW